MTSVLPNLAGYSVIGRHGYLGTVVEVDPIHTGSREGIVFRGGISDALIFHVPASHVCRISPSDRTLTLEVDVGDFAPRPGEDGTVELHLSR
jgi:hypothetical protein